MATTRLMPLHTGKGRTVGQAISDIIDYTENPQKTDSGRLITSWQCDSRIADAEFLFTKNQYIQKTGRVRGEDCCNPVMRGKAIMAAAIAAMMLLSLTVCGKLSFLSKSDQDTSVTGNTAGAVDVTTSVDTSISPNGDTTEDKDPPTNEDTAADDSWKAEFEKSLLDNYGVKPDHYEELENGVYQVYVEIDGKIVPYVAVDSATGDYHG